MTARKSPAQSWDEFWAEASGGRTEVIRGVEVTVPTDIPLAMEQRIGELRDSEAEDDIAELISLLFGVDALDTWRQNGMGVREFKTVFAWGIAHADGQDLSFTDALELVRQEEAAGKRTGPNGPNRAARRAQSKSTGGPSKRTSSASTASARNRSRA